MQTLLEVLAEIRRLDRAEALRFFNGFLTANFTATSRPLPVISTALGSGRATA